MFKRTSKSYAMEQANQSIQPLLDMGISHEVAVDALSRTNGDLEASVNYIFSGELQATTEHVDLTQDDSDSENGIKPGMLNDVIPNTDIITTVETREVENTIPDDVLASSGIMDSTTQLLKDSLNDPTVVLPLPPNALLENYFALFCLSVGISFPHHFLKPDFQDLNYNRNWFKGYYSKPEYRLQFSSNNNVSIVPKAQLTIQDSLTLQPELLWQFQKFIAVLNSSISDRKFVSAKIFHKVLEPLVLDKLGSCDHLFEVLPSFIKSLANDVEMCLLKEDARDIRGLFISTAYHKPSKDEKTIETLVSLLHFLPEEYDTNLYRMFNTLLYPEEDEDGEEVENSLGNLAPMLTVVFDEMDESTENVSLQQGVDVPLEFYPQIYTKNSKDSLINHVIAKRKEAQSASHAILQDLNGLKSFQGKHINSFLNSTVDFAAKDPLFQNDKDTEELLKSLVSVKEQITTKKTDKMEEYKNISHMIHNKWNLSHPDLYVVDAAKKMGLIDEPYLLTSAVLSPYHYYIRKRDGIWYRVISEANGSDLEASITEPHEVSESIKLATRHASETPLMFTYCKESKIGNEHSIRKSLEDNQGVSKFVKMDQTELEALQNNKESDDILIDL